MQGLMQDWPLTVDKIIDHARTWHGDREIVTRSVEGPIVRTTYARIHARAKQTSNALLRLGVTLGDRVATLAWCTGKHMEAWYGIMGIGAICHTLNPRLHPQQLAWIVNHAGDRLLFVDLTFLPLIEGILPYCPTLERVIVLTDGEHLPAFAPKGDVPPGFKGVIDFESLIAGEAAECPWGGFDENTAAGLCYTSGTTGDPKGVLYSHRSNFLHTFATLQTDVMGCSATDTVLAVVPMFHANGWGLPFAGPASGAQLVMPRAKLDGASLYELIETEQVTFTAAVPTVWQGLLQYLGQTGAKFTSLKRVLIGGAAVSERTIAAFRDDYGVEVVHAWGMTETSPLGTVSRPTSAILAKSPEEQLRYQLKQGRPPLGIELRVEGEDGTEAPHDGQTFGHLKVRGPFVAAAYFRGEGQILDADGFFDTGDIVTLDAEGYMQITDRSKDVIKSGGEWISTIEIENIVLGHPKTALAAVIGRPHPKWDERPLLLIKLKDGETATREEYLAFLDGKIAKWWMPDDVVFVDDIPLGATGKIDKKPLRERFADYVFPAAAAPIAEAAARPATLYAPEAFTDPPAVEAADDEPEPSPFPQADPAAETETVAGIAPEAEFEAQDLPPAEAAAPVVDAAPAESVREPVALAPQWPRKAMTAILAISFLPAALAILGAVGSRAGLFDASFGYGVMTTQWAANVAVLAALATLVGGGLALFVDRRLLQRAMLVSGITLVTLIAIWTLRSSAAAAPAHDVATDWGRPLAFGGAILTERGDAAPVEPDPSLPVGSGRYAGRRVAEVNSETCPGAVPVAVSRPPPEAFEAARNALRSRGAALTVEDPAAGRIEGTATSLGYGVKDDIAVRIQPAATGSRIDIRSLARAPGSDLGRNCRRVTRLVEQLSR